MGKLNPQTLTPFRKFGDAAAWERARRSRDLSGICCRCHRLEGDGVVLMRSGNLAYKAGRVRKAQLWICGDCQRWRLKTFGSYVTPARQAEAAKRYRARRTGREGRGWLSLVNRERRQARKLLASRLGVEPRELPDLRKAEWRDALGRVRRNDTVRDALRRMDGGTGVNVQ